jgi:hypothetical protein
MRRFVLRRTHDATGVSGTGDVAEGCQFTDGTVTIRWTTGEHRSTVVWASIAAAFHVHGHNGATVIKWCDNEE